MEKKLLHITNGDVMTIKIQKLKIPGDVVVWREILCEGPTTVDVGSDDFFSMRSNFLEKNYNIPPQQYESDFVKEVEKLAVINNYDEIVLWFEFDLFCHVNMIAAISFLIQNKKNEPVYLVCSSKLDGEDKVQNLSKLSLKQLHEHYKCRIKLEKDDLELAHHAWDLYCSSKPIRLDAEVHRSSNFEYLSSCLKAHIQRFPNAKNGLNTIERNVLRLIDEHEIISEHHLLGYALEYQGYFGYLELQFNKIIDRLRMFFEKQNGKLELNEKGKDALNRNENFYRDLKDDQWFGGAKKYDFLYDSDSHKLLKL